MGSTYSIYLSDETRSLVTLLCKKKRGTFSRVVTDSINKELEAEGLLNPVDVEDATELLSQLRDSGMKPYEVLSLVVEAKESGVNVSEVLLSEIRKAVVSA